LALLAAGPQRTALTYWWAWWRDISAIPYEVSDPTVAERKLAWWAQAVAEAHAAPPQQKQTHPLLLALLGNPALSAQAPPQALWTQQIQGMRQLVNQTRWLDEAALVAHMRSTTGAACEGAAWLAGARSAPALAAASDLGVALRRAHILIQLGTDARRGWLHLPVDLLQRHQVKAHEVLKPELNPDGTPTSAVARLLTAWQQDTSQALMASERAARALPSPERRALRPLLILARLNTVLLNDLHHAGYPVLAHRLSLGPWRKVWTAQKTRWGF
jgi:15-cis-phytoene synthase